jgi:hypothetical protein
MLAKRSAKASTIIYKIDLLYRRTSQFLYDLDFVIVLYGESLALHRQRWWTPEEDGLDKPKTGSCVIELDKP